MTANPPIPSAASLFSLSGRTAVITGSGRNIGKAIALLLASWGAKVVVNGLRDLAALEAVVGEIEAAGGTAHAVLADVSDPTEAARLVAEAKQKFGSVDIVISNVGVRRHSPFLDLSVAEWNAIMNINLNSAVWLARAALPLMMEKRRGRFIMMSGLDAFSPEDPGRAHIIASKLALHGLAKALALEFGPHGITVNSISPGLMATDRDWSHFGDFDREAFSAGLPLRRMGMAEDVASAALFLSSDAGAFVTGQVIHVNGGQRMF